MFGNCISIWIVTEIRDSLGEIPVIVVVVVSMAASTMIWQATQWGAEHKLLVLKHGIF